MMISSKNSSFDFPILTCLLYTTFLAVLVVTMEPPKKLYFSTSRKINSIMRTCIKDNPYKIDSYRMWMEDDFESQYEQEQALFRIANTPSLHLNENLIIMIVINRDALCKNTNTNTSESILKDSESLSAALSPYMDKIKSISTLKNVGIIVLKFDLLASIPDKMEVLRVIWSQSDYVHAIETDAPIKWHPQIKPIPLEQHNSQ